MYEIQICPIKKLYMIAEDADMNDVAVIAVSSREIHKEKFDEFFSALCFNFDDIVATGTTTSFNNDIAKEIAQYVKKLPASLDTLFVCCDFGQSRSAAMAAAIMRYNGLDDMKIWKDPNYCPNPLVYKLLCLAFGINVTDDELAKKRNENEKALYNVINKI